MEESTARAVLRGEPEVTTHPTLKLHKEPAAGVAFRHAATRYERWIKPARDRVIAAVVLLIMSPLMLVIAVAIRVTMGPIVIVLQSRVGLRGRIFNVLKFRTMNHDRRRSLIDVFEGGDRRLTHKCRDNPLITGLGRVLRKLSLDELPQLWNVVRGDMSLVGPRPQLVHLVEQLEPWAQERHAVKPGLTGLWQVTARRTRPMEECVELDLDYVDAVSFRMDMRILFLTVPVLLWPSGF